MFPSRKEYNFKLTSISNSDVHIQGTISSLGVVANNLVFRNRWVAYGQEIQTGTRLLEKSDFNPEYGDGKRSQNRVTDLTLTQTYRS
jgi:hypothetical protein